MRRLLALLAATALVASCGGTGEPEAPTTQPPPSSTTSSTTPPSTTPPPTTTTVPEEVDFTVSQYGLVPEVSLGPGAALGSGCAPETDTLPDGIWFGWIERAGPSSVEFDLACLWPGRLEPASSNDAARLRQLPVGNGTLVYLDDEPLPYSTWSGELTKATNAPGLPETLPFWVFVNDGVATEIARYPDPVAWALSATAWPELYPGCCDGGTVAPPSPGDPWPSTGWPADGFYDAWLDDYESWMETDPDYGFDLVIAKWLSCDEHADLCPEWWIGDEVTVDPDQPMLRRRLAFDEDLTVVIMPILAESPIVGNGVAFKSMLTDMQDSVAEWIDVTSSEEYWNEFRELAEDPAFPFGVPASEYSTEAWPMGYRGPGGTYLTWDHGWLALEIRDGLPVLYIHAGLIAG